MLNLNRIVVTDSAYRNVKHIGIYGYESMRKCEFKAQTLVLKYCSTPLVHSLLRC